MSDAPTRSASPAGDATADPPAPADGGTRDLHDPTADHSGGSTGPALPTDPPGYELLEEVGAGGMGVVYRAREIALDRDVAVKLLQNRYSPDSPGARRFVDEARITSQLQHPGIPPIHHVGTLPNGRPFLAMKLIKGDTLADLLDREPGNRGRYVAVFAQVCQAVAYAHSRKVIHRDLKPQNVMVGAFGEVQVMDWGLAKVLTGLPEAADVTEVADERTEIRSLRDADGATQAGAVLGTPAYMAPEQAQGAVEEIDERSDVFGLGAVLCAVLTGQPPYSGPNTESIRLQAIRGETADAFARLEASGADPELVDLCKRCLATARDARPRDAEEVARAVAAHLAAAEERARQAELDAVRAEGERATAEARAAEEANTHREAEARLAEQRKRRRAQLALAGSVVVVLALAAVGIGLGSLWQTAKQAQGEAENARDQLTDEKKQTEAARDEAVRQKDIAEKVQKAEREARQKLEMLEYGRTIQLAHQEMRNKDTVRALTLLEGTNPELRGWEWHYVARSNDDMPTKGHTGRVYSASFSADRSSRVVTGGADETAKVWDVGIKDELLILKGHTGHVYSASFSADGLRVVTGSGDDTAKVWDARTGTEILTLKGHTGAVLSASFSPNGPHIVTGGVDETAKVWDANTGTAMFTLRGHTGSVYSASFSPNGSRVVTGNGDGTARVWDAGTGAEILALKGHIRTVHSASFSADGSRVITGSGDGTARVWDARTGAEVLVLKGHRDVVYSASFSPNGSRVVTGSGDDTAKVWDARTGAELLTLKGHTGSVLSAAFSADGELLVTGSLDGTARVWDGARVIGFANRPRVPANSNTAARSEPLLRLRGSR